MLLCRRVHGSDIVNLGVDVIAPSVRVICSSVPSRRRDVFASSVPNVPAGGVICATSPTTVAIVSFSAALESVLGFGFAR